MRDNLSLKKYKLVGEKYSVAVADNTAVTLCLVPTGKTAYGVVLVNDVLGNGAVISSFAWTISATTVSITPQIEANTETGNAEFIVLWKR